MSVRAAGAVDAGAVGDRVRGLRRVLVRALVGDRVGLVLFLGTVLFAGLTWRIGFFITDNYTPANALVALADGSLAVDEAVYGSLEAPGMQIHDGTVYGRNYGQVAFAVPFLWALRAAVTVADPGLVFAALWSLGALAFAVQVGRLVERPTLAAAAGAGVSVAAFALNAALAEPIPARLIPMAALQLSAVAATGLAAATAYRLASRLHDRRLGVVAGSLTALATPVGFWASIPKRHVYVVALLLGVAYAFARSRGDADHDPDALLSKTGFRAAAYGLVGLLTWIHAGEGFVVFLALVLADLPTAPSNDRRTLAVVGAAFVASLVPFFLTNALISGDPVRPPRMLSQFGELTEDSTFGGSGGSDPSGGSRGLLRRLLPPALAGPASEVQNRVRLLFGPFAAGLNSVVERPDDVYRTLVRAGYIGDVGNDDHFQAINLTVLESAPVTAGVAGLVAVAATAATSTVRRGLARPSVDGLRAVRRRVRSSPARATDAFVGLAALLFFLTYISRLPLHAQVTVRYLLVLYPLGVYAVVRQRSIRRAVDAHWRLGLWSYLGGVLVGGQLLFVVVTAGAFGRGGAFQVHAVVGLAVAAAFALAAVGSALDERFDRATVVTGGLAAALGTDLILLSGVVYFQYGPYALPVVDWLADLAASA